MAKCRILRARVHAYESPLMSTKPGAIHGRTLWLSRLCGGFSMVTEIESFVRREGFKGG